MKNVSCLLFVFLGIIFWAFRVFVCLKYSMQDDFYFQPMNFKIELVILFLTVPCFIGILRRNPLSSLIYFGLYALYFGSALFENIIVPNPEIDILTKLSSNEAIVLIIGFVLPLFTLIDQLIEMNGSKLEDGTTTWYYKDEKYTRNIDKRADRNQYKIK